MPKIFGEGSRKARDHAVVDGETSASFRSRVATGKRDNSDHRQLACGTREGLLPAPFVSPLPLSQLPLHSRDKKDDKFLACALGGNCDYLVTEDDDLLVLNGKPELGKIQIGTAYEFLKRTGHV
jgi:PIN domain